MRISEIPQEVFAAALDYEGLERPEDIKDCEFWWVCETHRRMYTDGGLEKAISDYLLMTGLFAEGAEFEHLSGYTLEYQDSRSSKVF